MGGGGPAHLRPLQEVADAAAGPPRERQEARGGRQGGRQAQRPLLR